MGFYRDGRFVGVRTPNGVRNQWRSVFGDEFGYSQGYIDDRMAQARESADYNYAQSVRSGTANMASRGFYGKRPMAGMLGQLNTDRNRALTDYERGLRSESEQLAQNQKGMLFGALSHEAMAKQQQEYALQQLDVKQQYTLKNMDVQQQYDLARMAQQYQYDRDLIKLKRDLNSRGWGHLFGAVAGGLLGSVFGAAGTAVGTNIGERLPGAIGGLFRGGEED